MSTDLNKWIIQEIDDRGWSIRELARRANLVHGTINSVLAERSRPGPTFCTNIAYAFREPPERIFRMAGLLPPVLIGDEENAGKKRELDDVWKYLTSEQRETVVTLAKVLYEKREEYNVDNGKK